MRLQEKKRSGHAGETNGRYDKLAVWLAGLLSRGPN